MPADLELDPWNGEAWVGLVPFQMKQIRASFMPRVTALNFLETNLRTYVSYRGEPGVYFFSLDASSRLAVEAAKWGWGLPYRHAQMRTRREGRRIEYQSARRGGQAALDVRYEVGELLGPSQPDSLEFFLLERYLLFAHRRGKVSRGQVHHPPYPAQRATITHFEQRLLAAERMPVVDKPPAAVHYAEGVDVEVFGPHPA